jgi:gluconate 2-dehydrogenase alpha chain
MRRLIFRDRIGTRALRYIFKGIRGPPSTSGVHWNAPTWRFLPTDFQPRTHLTQRYGAKFLPEDMTIQDWGVTYDELDPHYDKFEYLCGTSGKAGNIEGQKQASR